MSIVKPWTFVAGNKARANEVNDNFDVLYQQVNANITDIANVEGEVQTLSATKADINGSSVQRFAVADPVSSGDAVNKRTFFKQIANSIDYIGGLTISKDSGSPNDTILIDPGAAYDSTKQVVLALDVLTTKQNTTQSASATYYVYIIGNATGSSIDILISTEASVPTLPAGYTLYRQIGYYTTDSDSYINSISYYGLATNSDMSPNGIFDKITPDYSGNGKITTGYINGSENSYTIPFNCFVIVKDEDNFVGSHNIIVNNATIHCWYNNSTQSLQVPYASFNLCKGDVVYSNMLAKLEIYKIKGEV